MRAARRDSACQARRAPRARPSRPGAPRARGRCRPRGRRSERTHHLVTSIEELWHETTADSARSAGDENSHVLASFWFLTASAIDPAQPHNLSPRWASGPRAQRRVRSSQVWSSRGCIAAPAFIRKRSVLYDTRARGRVTRRRSDSLDLSMSHLRQPRGHIKTALHNEDRRYGREGVVSRSF